ncbi:hypothetical protein FVQ98_14110 [Ottowia sp. GY511]|uniref:Uncharacterized protein n=1 Tax=Ottowia flava TaxID=2675430 RepID=A0ABW4KRL3_9BURK|nr:hypothetical protein [Ottowia sp. GY511]TXK26507.1 hypothetical protein FVQ98_14110 [Ottowia sp. GY511]
MLIKQGQIFVFKVNDHVNDSYGELGAVVRAVTDLDYEVIEMQWLEKLRERGYLDSLAEHFGAFIMWMEARNLIEGVDNREVPIVKFDNGDVEQKFKDYPVRFNTHTPEVKPPLDELAHFSHNGIIYKETRKGDLAIEGKTDIVGRVDRKLRRAILNDGTQIAL